MKAEDEGHILRINVYPENSLRSFISMSIKSFPEKTKKGIALLKTGILSTPPQFTLLNCNINDVPEVLLLFFVMVFKFSLDR